MNMKKAIAVPITVLYFIGAVAVATVSADQLPGEWETELEEGFIKSETKFLLPLNTIQVLTSFLINGSVSGRISCFYSSTSVDEPIIDIPPGLDVMVECKVDNDGKLVMELLYEHDLIPRLENLQFFMQHVGSTITFHTSQHLHLLHSRPDKMKSEWGEEE